MQNPIVTFETTRGTIKAELYPEIAPNTVNNFISLIQKGFYDGTIFHRVIPGFMIQGGERPEAHHRRSLHGKKPAPEQRRQPVLHHGR